MRPVKHAPEEIRVKMRSRLLLVFVAASTFVIAVPAPASATVVYTVTAAASVGSLPTVDPSTNTIYSIADVTDSGGNEKISLDE